MKAMEILQQYWEQLKRLWVYIQFCLDNDMGSHVCQGFWRWTMYLAIAVALMIAFVVGRIVLREQLEWHRNRKRLAARGIVADAQTMEELRWKGEDNRATDLSEQELAERMREAIRVKQELDSKQPK